MKLRLLSCVAASMLLLSSAAGAQSSRPVAFGFGGGMSVPVSNAKDAFKTGFHGQAMVQWKGPGLPIGLRGTLGYERMGLKSLTPGLDGNGSILSGLANVTLGVSAGPLRPYVIAGLGAFNTRTDVSGASGASKTQFGIDGGAGVEFKLGPASGFIEGKLQNIFTDQGWSSALGSAKEFSTRIIPVTFGVFF
jgi:opacity protein-like surface antigen